MNILIQCEVNDLIESTVKIIKRVFKTRAFIKAQVCEKDPDIILSIDKTLEREAYSISNEKNAIKISGGDYNGILYGAGRWLRGCSFGEFSFKHGSWCGTSKPNSKFRGIYFATHFGNYYDEASLDEIDIYLEDLALWGCNSLGIWFDMHHFRSISDAGAQLKISRLKHMLETAGRLGMSGGLIFLVNEAYANSPLEMRADWKAGKNGYTGELMGHYHLELCPSKPGAIELTLKWREEVFDAFKGTNIKYFVAFGYDQGGCTCRECAPWAVNGMQILLKKISDLSKEKFPASEFIMSCWRFDSFIKGEWDGIYKLLETKPDYINGLEIDLADLEKAQKAPGNLPIIGMPEISMAGMLPWGGYGANPRPSHIKEVWKKAGFLAGTYPYSEGIYEDINKIIILLLEWDSEINPDDAVKEYLSFYFSHEKAVDLAKAVNILEENLGHSYGEWKRLYLDNELHYANYGGPAKGAEEAFRIFEEAEKDMSAEISSSWRWRILKIRAEIDFLISKGVNAKPDFDFTLEKAGFKSLQIDELLTELRKIYHANPETCITCLTPPTMGIWRKFRQENKKLE